MTERSVKRTLTPGRVKATAKTPGRVAARKLAAPARRRRPDERPTQILEAALDIFGEKGLAAARLEDIAKRAGLAKGTIYLYFPNKEALFREMIRRTLVVRLEALEQAPQIGRAHV